VIAASALGRELLGTARQSGLTLRFLSLRERLLLSLAVLLMAGVGFLTAFIPLTLGSLIDAMLQHRVKSLSQASEMLWLLAGAYMVREALQVARKIVVEGTCTRVESRARVGAVSSLLRLSLATFGAEQAGTLNGRLSRSVSGMVRLLKLSFLDFFPALFAAGFALAAAINKSTTLGLIMAGVVPVGLMVILFQLATQRGIRIALRDAREEMDGTIVEQIGGIESVRAANASDREIGKVAVISESLRRKEFRHHRAMAFFDALKSLFEGGFHIAVIVVSMALALAESISTGDILAFSMLFLAVVTPLREIHRIVDEAHESALLSEQFFELLRRPPDRSFDTPDAGYDLSAEIVIEARGLCVAYALADGTSRDALVGVEVEVRRGEVVGLAGPSGSGKTTFVRSLLRLVHPQGGQLKVGGQLVSDLSRANVRACFGFVSQTPFLFSGSVAENIAFGTPNASEAEIRRAAAMARIDAEIEAFPGGYGYAVGERGVNLSGGQRQRLALARVFLQDPPILILDEATAALDNRNERAVMDALTEALKGRTVLMVAHRLSSLQRADRIIVFRDGRIVEEGKFDELLANPLSAFSAVASDPSNSSSGPAICPRSSEAFSTAA
jgi:ATP-binding cassette, subfamily B, bacterial